ncbi:MAG: hypothetical protein M3Y65_05365 [Pseudomonadota bacterium]|nr:hypothetical protein [Pseudomonadota bacterium]
MIAREQLNRSRYRLAQPDLAVFHQCTGPLAALVSVRQHYGATPAPRVRHHRVFVSPIMAAVAECHGMAGCLGSWNTGKKITLFEDGYR